MKQGGNAASIRRIPSREVCLQCGLFDPTFPCGVALMALTPVTNQALPLASAGFDVECVDVAGGVTAAAHPSASLSDETAATLSARSAQRGSARRLLVRLGAGLFALLAAASMPAWSASPYDPTVATVDAGNGGFVRGASGAGATQDFALVEQAVRSYLMQQTEGLPGRVTISVAPAAPTGLAACPALEPFVPPGVRLWGKAMVGVRCNGERPWTIYLQARIGVDGTYYVAARSMNSGTAIGMQDLDTRQGDLTALPASVITNPSQAVGAVTMNAVTAGMPLRSDLLRAAIAIRFGQEVKLVAQGNGFAVSSEGSALMNASAGQTVRVRTASGVIVSGTAQADASVNVPL
jgi:flagella basal body P-ring formation protein FlgA